MVPILLAFAAVSVAGSAAAPSPGAVKVFSDWAVACDNGKRCEAVAMIPEAAQSDVGLWMRREAGPAGALTLHLHWPNGPAGAKALIVDGRRFALISSGDDIVARGGEALRIARALANATAASAVAGQATQPVFSHGSAAAMRYIDAAQGRAGTVTALVANGAAPATTIAAAPPLPIIAAPSPSRRAATKPSAAMIAAMRAQSHCAASDDPMPSADSAALDDTATLILLSCGSGAYNASSLPYVLIGGRFRIAAFDAPTGMSGDPGAQRTLTNASLGADGTLTSVARGRGVGDCGVSQSFVWDGRRFRLIEQRELGECRGGAIWPTTWRARVVHP